MEWRDRQGGAAGSWPGFGLPPALDRNLLNLEPPDHTRIRRLIASTFTPRRVESLRHRIQQTVDDCLDEITVRAGGDLVSELALPVALTTMSELLGVGPQDRRDFRAWTAVLVAHETGRPADLAETVANIYHYFTALIASKRATPGDDLISALIAARDKQDRLSEEELVSAAWLTMIAGNENTVRGIANAILALLCDPAAAAQLRENPALISGAIEEMLRYDGPAQMAIRRFALEEITIGNTTIPAGDAVMVAIACANRDRGRFIDAEQLDLTRADNPHLAFGNGIHYCFGAPLARLESEITIRTLLRRFPELALAVSPDELRWEASIRSRDLTELPVIIGRTDRHNISSQQQAPAPAQQKAP